MVSLQELALMPEDESSELLGSLSSEERDALFATAPGVFLDILRTHYPDTPPGRLAEELGIDPDDVLPILDLLGIEFDAEVIDLQAARRARAERDEEQ